MMFRRSPKATYTVIALVATLALFAILAWFTDIHAYLLWLAATGTVLFALYGYDKTEAKVGGGRVPEIVLHGMALVGGFAGGWAGMFIFRHKTRKPVFKVVLVMATVLHAALLYLL